MTARYLSRAEVAARIGVKPDTLGRYRMPEPDAMIGSVRGWLPSTIDAWHAARPGRGVRAELEPRTFVGMVLEIWNAQGKRIGWLPTA